MATLTCPKCRRGLPDEALDAEQCSLCGFPLEGPVVLTAPGARTGGTRLPVAIGAALLVAVTVAGYALLGDAGAPITPPVVEVAAIPPLEPPTVPERHVAPLPHEPHRPETPPTDPVDEGRPPGPAEPLAKKGGPRPIGVQVRVDPRVEPKRHFDQPDDTVSVVDLNTGDRVVLTGRVRVLRVGQINGKGALDASGLIAEEVVLGGDLRNEAQASVNAPNGAVTLNGFVSGAAKLTIAAPGGEVAVAGFGRLSGGPLVTVTAKRLDVKCPLSGNARVNVTLTAPGALKLALLEEGATVTYKKSAANDPPPTVEKGAVRDGARVIAAN